MDSNLKCPASYVCAKCGASRQKLWRQYNTFLNHIELLCRPCALLDQKRTEDRLYGDQIGGLIPAVPTPDGRSFWGYSSVPIEGIRWWYLLPPDIKRHPEYLLPTPAWIKKLYDDYKGCRYGGSLRALMLDNFKTEVIRTGFVDFCLTDQGTYRIGDMDFPTKMAAQAYCETNRVESVIDFRE